MEGRDRTEEVHEDAAGSKTACAEGELRVDLKSINELAQTVLPAVRSYAVTIEYTIKRSDTFYVEATSSEDAFRAVNEADYSECHCGDEFYIDSEVESIEPIGEWKEKT